MNPKGYIVNYFITNHTSGTMQYMIVKDKPMDSDEVQFFLGTIRINDKSTEALLQGFLAAQPIMVQPEEYRIDKSEMNRGISSYDFAKRFADLSNYNILEFGIPNVLETVRNDRFLDTLSNSNHRAENKTHDEAAMKKEIDEEIATSTSEQMLETAKNTFEIFKTDVGVMNKVGTYVEENNELLKEKLNKEVVQKINDNIKNMLEDKYVIKNYTLELTRVSRFLEEIVHA